ncbi:MAG: sugar phosphate isomerase/epimerase [Actinomycetota bacterium]|nr:sugar phosphate isomerase/epimerase [Actinomycetota bacterium]
MKEDARIAGAPVSWGVIEIPDWGYQMSPDRVLREASSLGLSAMEAGPKGFLPEDPDEVSSILDRYGLGLVGGFVPAILHVPGKRDEQLSLVEKRAEFFATAGADVLVLAAFPDSDDFGEMVELDDGGWKELFANLSRAEEIAARHGLTVVLHSHYGTAVERDDQLWRFLEGCDMGLCLDTAHLVIGGSDPLEVAEKAADRVKLAHLKDVDTELARQMATREIGFKEAAQRGAFLPLGDGDVDIARLLALLERAEYNGWYVLEQDTVVETEPQENGGPITDARKSIAFLEQQLEELAEPGMSQ